MTRPAIIVYGNCQSDTISTCLRQLPAISERFDVVSIPSFVHPIDGPAKIDPVDVGRCAALIEQRALWHGFPAKDALPRDAVHVDFPVLALNALWPLQAKEARNTAEPDFPFGRYPYGDRLLNRLLARGLGVDGTLEAYLSTSLAAVVDMQRFTAIENERIAALDKICALPFGAWMLSRFRHQQLFWTYNHPTSALLQPLAEAVVELLCRRLGLPVSVADGVAPLFAEGWEPADWLKVALHPEAAAHLGLNWYGDGLLYAHYTHRDVDYAAYWRHQIAFD